jgi:hypothetical protein
VSKRKPFKSLSSANREIAKLHDRLADFQTLVEAIYREREQLAKLASKTPMFNNPLHVMAAESIRDRVLRLPKSMPRDWNSTP